MLATFNLAALRAARAAERSRLAARAVRADVHAEHFARAHADVQPEAGLALLVGDALGAGGFGRGAHFGAEVAEQALRMVTGSHGFDNRGLTRRSQARQ